MLRHKENFKLKMHFTLKTMDRNVKNQGNKSKLSHCTSNSNTINYAAFHRLKTVSFFFHCSAFNFSRSEEFRCVNSQVDHLKSLLWSILNHHSASIRLYNPMHIHNAMHLLPLHCLIFTSCCRYYYYCCFWYYSHFNLCKTSVFFFSPLYCRFMPSIIQTEYSKSFVCTTREKCAHRVFFCSDNKLHWCLVVLFIHTIKLMWLLNLQ